MSARNDTYTLISNISYVAHRGVRLHVSAIVIVTESHHAKQPHRRQVRMFGPSPNWPVADVDVPIGPHTLTERVPEFLRALGDYRPQWRTYDLTFASADSAERFAISTNLQDGSEIVVREFPEGTSISKVWDALVPACIAAWDAPRYPILEHVGLSSLKAGR